VSARAAASERPLVEATVPAVVESAAVNRDDAASRARVSSAVMFRSVSSFGPRIHAAMPSAVVALVVAAASVGCSEEEPAPAPETGSVPYEFVSLDSGGHSAFVTNAVAQERIRAFVGSSGAPTTGKVTPVSTTLALDGATVPVEVQVYVPDGASGPTDAVVLFHGTIESATAKPQDGAAKYLEAMRGAVKVSDKVLVAVAYPQDAIPLANQTAFGDVGGLLFGDNILHARAAVAWVRDGLPSWLATAAPQAALGRTFLFGHSQGAYLAHRLNALVTTDGVIANAPGPIDLLDRCRQDEEGPNDNITCNKLEKAVGSTTTNPEAYASRSLLQFLEGSRATALYLQAVDDTAYQVDRMREFETAFRAANP